MRRSYKRRRVGLGRAPRHVSNHPERVLPRCPRVAPRYHERPPPPRLQQPHRVCWPRSSKQPCRPPSGESPTGHHRPPVSLLCRDGLDDFKHLHPLFPPKIGCNSFRMSPERMLRTNWRRGDSARGSCSPSFGLRSSALSRLQTGPTLPAGPGPSSRRGLRVLTHRHRHGRRPKQRCRDRRINSTVSRLGRLICSIDPILSLPPHLRLPIPASHRPRMTDGRRLPPHLRHQNPARRPRPPRRATAFRTPPAGLLRLSGIGVPLRSFVPPTRPIALRRSRSFSHGQSCTFCWR